MGEIGDREAWQGLGLGTPKIQSYAEREGPRRRSERTEGKPSYCGDVRRGPSCNI